jgi:chloramphenicol 3-O phosphotransferase
MPIGNIIYLNGTSSAGKSSLAAALQSLLPAPYLHVSLDLFLGMFPPRYAAVLPFGREIPPQAREGIIFLYESREGRTELDILLGPAGRQLLTGMRHAIRALAVSGSNVIVDDVLLGREILVETATVLGDLPVTFVKVYCPLNEVERRERERGDRLLGLAAWQLARVHEGVMYDLEVDTARHSPVECAQQVAQLVASAPTPSAFERLRQSLMSHAESP